MLIVNLNHIGERGGGAGATFLSGKCQAKSEHYSSQGFFLSGFVKLLKLICLQQKHDPDSQEFPYISE